MTTAALEAAYDDLLGVVTTLDDDAGWQPTACTGWMVRDLVFHVLGDAQRALVALATPAGRRADIDAVGYWRQWGNDTSTGTTGAVNGRRFTRVVASMWGEFEPLRDLYVETARAVLVAARRAEPEDVVATQGHAIGVRDFLSTLAVEATLHHLDLVVHLDAPPPGPEALAHVRAVLDGLAGEPVTLAISDEDYAAVATGRRPVTDRDRRMLGDVADRMPFFS